jgi:arylsulfatase A-like enzyme
LLTGRYHYRTGVVDTYVGRSLMHPDEVTLAEMLSAAGYRTGIFGKWHLGDNYPLRPIDQGFQEALVHKGGGIGQPSDPPGGESYFNPILQHNGTSERTQGYCSDIYTTAALRFIDKNRHRPFFIWLAFNAPHTPLEVPPAYERRYQELNLSADQFPAIGQPIPKAYSPETTAKIYGMVENIDDNVGRLLARLQELGLTDQTLIVFLTDNGPQQPRYNGGLRERKGTVYEGGLRVPCFFRWPGQLAPNREISSIAAHIDLAPTLLAACSVPPTPGVHFDGRNLWPVLRGESVPRPERTLFFQWHRGDVPERYRAFAARAQDFKLVQAEGTREGPWTNTPSFQLFNLANDPFEERDLADQRPDVVLQLKEQYDHWFTEVTSQRDYTVPARIHIGSARERRSVLTRQDWRGSQAGWTPTGLGHWDVLVTQPRAFRIRLHFAPLTGPATARLTIGTWHGQSELGAGTRVCEFRKVKLPPGPTRIEAALETGPDRRGVNHLEVDY